jgi:hypothetical protein
MDRVLNQIEGQWEELVRKSDQFAGRRVRVSVLADEAAPTSPMHIELRRWLAEGDMLTATPTVSTRPDAFGDALADKFRKQGLVI